MGLHFDLIFFAKKDLKIFLRDLSGWGIFIAYELTFILFTSGHISRPFDVVCYYALNIILFYFNALVLFPFGIRSKAPSIIVIPILVIIEMVIYLIIKYCLDYLMSIPADGFPEELSYIKLMLVPNIYRGIYFIGFSALYWSILRTSAFRNRAFDSETKRLSIEKENAELERNLAEAMNAYLQQQINPHLLFNTLTFIHNTYYKHSKAASQCVMLLVDIMRFTLDDVDINGRTQLSKELAQIENFIEINQLRFDHELQIDFQLRGDTETPVIIPLVLLTLTENIFKHGYLRKKDGHAKLHISVNERNELTFSSWNLKKHQPENKRIKSLGIKNVIKRLEHSYKHQYDLRMVDGNESFAVELKM
ncbi:sensor histidine kinase [uncultured Mucilaginibacter sp.]|uniref:sensor histidine kinase n=1 Tax=uncultured Mucilaginibacter sp. TaxID=797541 RepID=UPI0025CC22E8|nr:sensor histidine kinase [uncultured Mucilaginibacter sp.]